MVAVVAATTWCAPSYELVLDSADRSAVPLERSVANARECLQSARCQHAMYFMNHCLLTTMRSHDIHLRDVDMARRPAWYR